MSNCLHRACQATQARWRQYSSIQQRCLCLLAHQMVPSSSGTWRKLKVWFMLNCLYKAPAIGLYSKSVHLALVPFYSCCLNYGRFILCSSQKFLLDLLWYSHTDENTLEDNHMLHYGQLFLIFSFETMIIVFETPKFFFSKCLEWLLWFHDKGFCWAN